MQIEIPISHARTALNAGPSRDSIYLKFVGLLSLLIYEYVWPACSINKQECNAAIEGDTLEKGRKLLPTCVCVC